MLEFIQCSESFRMVLKKSSFYVSKFEKKILLVVTIFAVSPGPPSPPPDLLSASKTHRKRSGLPRGPRRTGPWRPARPRARLCWSLMAPATVSPGGSSRYPLTLKISNFLEIVSQPRTPNPSKFEILGDFMVLGEKIDKIS